MSKYRTKVYCIKHHKYISNLVYLGYCTNSRNMRINYVSEKRKMASSLIHLAITNEFANKIKVKDIKRLRMGSMLPDNVGPKRARKNIYMW